MSDVDLNSIYSAQLTHSQTMSGRFEGRIAIVTGGGDGLGKGITKRLVSEGCKVEVANSAISAIVSHSLTTYYSTRLDAGSDCGLE